MGWCSVIDKCKAALRVQKNDQGLTKEYKEKIMLDFYCSANPTVVLKMAETINMCSDYVAKITGLLEKYKDDLPKGFLKDLSKRGKK